MVASCSRFICSSIGRKTLIALTGLALCGFLVGHLTGNFLLMVGPDAFNLYGHKLISLGVGLYVIEAILSGIFLLHLGLAIKVTIENKQARGNQKYLVKKRTGRGSTFMSDSMPYTGLVLLAFLISHLLHFKFGPHYTTTVDGVEMRDLYKVVMEYFQSIGGVIWYSFAMICAALHTSHGFSSAFQSLGLNHSKYFKNIKKLGVIYAVLVGGGFAFLAVWAHLKGV
jgi:succinate dehydrogenase / fumarate reductase, cytochrome b subunit